jgi:hypothetical protein
VNGTYGKTYARDYDGWLFPIQDWDNATLQKSLDLGKRGDSVGGFFLAMAHWRLGHEDEARKWYDRAVEWMERSQPANRAEAAQLLGVEKKRD